MQITALESVIVHVNHRGDWLFVYVHTDEGLTGLGEASHSGNDALAVAVLAQYERLLAGSDPLQIESLIQRMARLDGGRIGHTVLSGIEQALWDILGQRLGVPVHVLFGGAMRERLRLYANINRHVRERTPAGFAEAARRAVDEGFGAIKLAPFDELNAPDHIRTGPQAAWRAGVARVQAVRAAIGDSVELAVDCHGRMEASEALVVAAALADCGLFWYEEPVPDHQIDDLAQITGRVPMPTASAESLFGMAGFAPFLSRRVVDVLMPDVKHDGGLLATKQIAGAAAMHQLLVAPHNPAGPVATAATAQVISTAPNFYILEYAWGEVEWRADLLAPTERIEDGYLVLSQEPGIGHQLDPAVLEAHRRRNAAVQDSSKVRPVG
jgi:galactonate dehydratase